MLCEMVMVEVVVVEDICWKSCGALEFGLVG
jgi:hypothetical protein